MGQDSTTTLADGTEPFSGEAWFDPIEAGVRERVRGFIEELLEQELTQALGRARHERASEETKGYRNGTRERRLLGSFGPVQISVPRARLTAGNGGKQEWRSVALPRYARMTRQVEALIAGAYLAGTNTRRVKRALTALFAGALGKDLVSRTSAAWRHPRAPDRRWLAHAAVPDHRWWRRLERALAALWPDVPAQRCTVHKHRNLLAPAPDALHDEAPPTTPR